MTANITVVYQRYGLDGADAAAYTEFVARARGTHYMQQLGWCVVGADPTQARRYVIVRDGERVIGAAQLVRGMRGPVRSLAAVIERGPVVDDVQDLDRVLPALLRVTRWHGVDSLRVQPYFTGTDGDTATAIAARHGFTPSSDLDGPYTATLRVPLAGVAPDALFAGKELSETRRCARKAREAGATVRRGGVGDLRPLAALYATMMNAQGGSDRSPGYFASFAPLIASGAAALFCGEFAGELDCAVLVAWHPGQVTLHLAATTLTKRSYKKMLLPIWAAAEWGIERGAAWLDLGGVPPAHDLDAKRRHIAQFKFDFAHTPVTLPPPMYSTPTRAGAALRRAVTATRRLRLAIRG